MTDDYEVGYGKPPKRTQFTQGQSGNPKGRSKGTRNFKTDLREELAEPVNVREDGSVTTVSSQRAILKQLRAKALKGDPRALDRFLALAERYDLDDAADEAEQDLSGADQSILERFKDRVVREHEAVTAAKEEGECQEQNE